MSAAGCSSVVPAFQQRPELRARTAGHRAPVQPSAGKKPGCPGEEAGVPWAPWGTGQRDCAGGRGGRGRGMFVASGLDCGTYVAADCISSI